MFLFSFRSFSMADVVSRFGIAEQKVSKVYKGKEGEDKLDDDPKTDMH